MQVRQATPEDLSRIMQLERAASTAAHWPLAHYEAIATGVDAARFLFLAEELNVEGFLVARQVAGEWEIENILVSREFQRRGIGSLLLKTLVQTVRGNRGGTVFLEVRESNQPARVFYEKSGFRQIARRPRYYRGPGEDAIVYKMGV